MIVLIILITVTEVNFVGSACFFVFVYSLSLLLHINHTDICVNLSKISHVYFFSRDH